MNKKGFPPVTATAPPPPPRAVNECSRGANEQELAKGFNEWMRRFIEEPARFRREFEVVREFMKWHDAGQVPTYGETAAFYILNIIDETR
jgi:hypothetical protein